MPITALAIVIPQHQVMRPLLQLFPREGAIVNNGGVVNGIAAGLLINEAPYVHNMDGGVIPAVNLG